MLRKQLKKTEIKSAWWLSSNGFKEDFDIKREYPLKKVKKRAVEENMLRKQLKKSEIKSEWWLLRNMFGENFIVKREYPLKIKKSNWGKYAQETNEKDEN